VKSHGESGSVTHSASERRRARPGEESSLMAPTRKVSITMINVDTSRAYDPHARSVSILCLLSKKDRASLCGAYDSNRK
jgi:hypothetical protein